MLSRPTILVRGRHRRRDQFRTQHAGMDHHRDIIRIQRPVLRTADSFGRARSGVGIDVSCGAWIRRDPYSQDPAGRQTRENHSFNRLIPRWFGGEFRHVPGIVESQRALDVVAKIAGRPADIKRVGPASLDLCKVADGTYDAYFEPHLHEWDVPAVSAGAMVIWEAQGHLTQWNGEGVHWRQENDVVATNGLITNDLSQYLA